MLVFKYAIYLFITLFFYWVIAREDIKKKIVLAISSIVMLAMLSWASFLFLSAAALINFLLKKKLGKILVLINFGIYLLYLAINREMGVIYILGGSFYCFKLISYAMDKENEINQNWLNYFTWIFFFPTLVSGPIQKIDDFILSFNNKENLNSIRFDSIAFRIVRALFKKIVLVELCSSLIGAYINESHSIINSLTVLFINFLQVTLDFSAYVDLAIAISLAFGIIIPENFHFSYFSKNISDFWKRHHITLGKWFSEYVYFPSLGFINHKADVKKSMLGASALVFFISGFWHVPSLNGLIFFVLNFLCYWALFGNIHPNLKILHRLYMWIAVLISFWLIIYSLESLTTIFTVEAFVSSNFTYLISACLIALSLYVMDRLNEITGKSLTATVVLSALHCALFIFTLINSSGTIKSFIYSRF